MEMPYNPFLTAHRKDLMRPEFPAPADRVFNSGGV
jgi:hypothetical protein